MCIVVTHYSEEEIKQKSVRYCVSNAENYILKSSEG